MGGEIIGTVGHDRSLPRVLSELPATEARRHRSVAEQTHGSREKFCAIANLAMQIENDLAPAEQNSTTNSRYSRTFSDNNTTARIDMALAAEGAAVARGIAETARIVRAARLRDMLAAVEEWRRADGADRARWRQDALHRLQEWRRIYRQPERAAFQRAVIASRRAPA